MFVGMSSWRQLRKEIYKTSFFRPAEDENEQQQNKIANTHGMSSSAKGGIRRGAFQHDATKMILQDAIAGVPGGRACCSLLAFCESLTTSVYR
jgi:hypothetical protein